MPATIKNAIDFLHHEWSYKPVGFVSYGGISAGTRSVAQLKQVVSTLKMFPLTDAVSIPFVRQFINDAGAVNANETMEEASDALLEELLRVERVLRALRAPS
jgi:NAD(P)H-dependent FMN reductase